MQIVLMRHGKPEMPDPGKIRANEIHYWIKIYNAAGLDNEFRPTRRALDIAVNCNTVACSDLLRSVDSTEALGLKDISCIDPVFREAGLPYARFPSPGLSPEIWAVIFRVLWYIGFSSNGESLAKARLRASSAASRLNEIARKHGSVLLVGHGFMNRFIAKKLLSCGWKGPQDPGRQYWDFGVYEYGTT